MKTQQLVIWDVPYDFKFSDDCKIVQFVSEHWANILLVPKRKQDDHEGFWVEKQFIDVVVYGDTIEFTSQKPISIEMLETWFRDNIHAFDSIGYEVLVKEQVVQ